MSREKIAGKVIKYLEERLNCENVMKFIEKTLVKNGVDVTAITGKKKIKLKIGDLFVTVEIIPYNDNDTAIADIVNRDITKEEAMEEEYELEENEREENEEEENEQEENDREEYEQEEDNELQGGQNLLDNEWVQKQFKIYDFITEANYTGFEYFPYLYGVLNCHDGDKSRLYVFYEYFEGNLLTLFDKMEHPSEWYDIVFQFIITNYYIEIINGLQFSASLENYLYKKLPKPIYQQYNFDSYKFNINHKYRLGLWDIGELTPRNSSSDGVKRSNNSILLEYIENNKDKFKIQPSFRIIKLLQDVIEHPDNVLVTLDQYYNPKENTKKETSE